MVHNSIVSALLLQFKKDRRFPVFLNTIKGHDLLGLGFLQVGGGGNRFGMKNECWEYQAMVSRTIFIMNKNPRI